MVAAVVPKNTCREDANVVSNDCPEIVTTVPPATEPDAGKTLSMRAGSTMRRGCRLEKCTPSVDTDTYSVAKPSVRRAVAAFHSSSTGINTGQRTFVELT